MAISRDFARFRAISVVFALSSASSDRKSGATWPLASLAARRAARQPARYPTPRQTIYLKTKDLSARQKIYLKLAYPRQKIYLMLYIWPNLGSGAHSAAPRVARQCGRLMGPVPVGVGGAGAAHAALEIGSSAGACRRRL